MNTTTNAAVQTVPKATMIALKKLVTSTVFKGAALQCNDFVELDGNEVRRYFSTGLLDDNGESFVVGLHVPGLNAPNLWVNINLVKAALVMNKTQLRFEDGKLNGMDVASWLCSSDAVIGKELASQIRAFQDGQTVCEVPCPSVLQSIRDFAATQDFRHYLNGVAFDLTNHAIVGTDGHTMMVSNGTTLPVYPEEVLKDVGRNPLIVSNIMLQTLDLLGASSFQVRNPPELMGPQPKAKEGVSPKTLSKQLFAQNETGYLKGDFCKGVFPDWRRFVPSGEARTAKQQKVFSDVLDRRLNPVLSNNVDGGVDKRFQLTDASIPVMFKGVTQTLASYAQALNSVKSKFVGVKLNLHTMGLESSSDNGILISPAAKVQLATDCFEHPSVLQWLRENDGLTTLVVNVQYLLKAIKALGEDAVWWVSKNGMWSATVGEQTVVMMPMRL